MTDKLNTALQLLFYFFNIIHVAKMQNSMTLYEQDVTEEQAAKLIGEIQHQEVLPLVLISHPNHNTLSAPTHIVKVETKNKRMINGTQFSDGVGGKQIFFCPNDNSREKCLVPREFEEEFEQLQCANEPIPLIQEIQPKSYCIYDSSNSRSMLHKVVYKICPTAELKEYKTKEIKIYEFCYDRKKENVLFTRHQIQSQSLLSSKLLFRERAMEYPLTVRREIRLSNLQQLIARQDEKHHWFYQQQKFVPSEDMAFALWKKPTYEYFNVELQQEKLIPLWDKINRYIRNGAGSNFIYTGVFGSDTDIWVKVIYNEDSNPQEGVAILINNFVIEKPDEADQYASSDSDEYAINEYCEENRCVEALRDEFEKIGGKICCCRLTSDIGRFFGMPNIQTDTKLLAIPNITI